MPICSCKNPTEMPLNIIVLVSQHEPHRGAVLTNLDLLNSMNLQVSMSPEGGAVHTNLDLLTLKFSEPTSQQEL